MAADDVEAPDRAGDAASDRGASAAQTLSPARQRLLELRRRQNRQGPAGAQIAAARTTGEEPAATYAQEALWFLDALTTSSLHYHSTLAARLSGAINMGALQRSLETLVERHESLRMSFATRDGKPVPRLSAMAPIELLVREVSPAGPEQTCTEIQRLLLDASTQPFDLSQAPLLRVRLLRLASEEHVLQLVVHHIVSDGWSMGVIAGELNALYAAFSAGKVPALPPMSIRYGDYARWQRERLRGKRLDSHMSFWRDCLQGLEPLELPTDRPRPARSTHAGSLERFTVPAAVLEGLRTLARRHDATLFMALLSAFKVLLMRYTGQKDLAVGSPVAGRNRPELECLVGYFVNTLVLRTDLSGNPSFTELLCRVRDGALRAYVHQELPFDLLVAELKPERDLSRNPLFQVSFGLNNQPAQRLNLAGVRTEPLAWHNQTAKFDLSMSLTEANDGLQGSIEYSTELFDGATIQRMVSHFQTLLGGIVADPGQSLALLPVLTADERSLLLNEWNQTARPYPAHSPVHFLFEQQVLRTPNAVALVFEDRHLSYRQLDAKSNQLARHLRSRGIGRHALVGLAVERGIGMVVAQLAVLKAGAAYVPLDPEYPVQRLAFMAEDAELALLVTESTLMHAFARPREQYVLLDADAGLIATQPEAALAPEAAFDARPEDPAYVIFTSGTTGHPKGVVVPHRAVVNFLVSMAREPGLSAADRLVAVTTLSFDIAVLELLLPLTVGAAIILADGEQSLDGQALRALLETSGSNMMQATPVTWRMLIDAGWKGTPTFKALIGGESLQQDLAERLLERTGELWNMYGPTETTVYSTGWKVECPERGISIGRPITNTIVRVLDEHRQLCPAGVPGEIHIGGDGVALGYLHRPELSAERFIADPFSATAGAKLYRTGDRGRWRGDGLIEHQGRLDFQVKVRGHRIEPGEIEHRLASHPQVARSIVIVREDRAGDSRLVAYVVARDAMPSVQELRAHLRSSLPEYMVPMHFVQLDKIPLLPNGKTNRSQLPPPPEDLGRTGIVAPRSPAEHAVWDIWRDILGIETFGVHDNFFELGGHSLMATQIVSRVRATLQIELPLRTLFESPTVGSLVQRLPGFGRTSLGPRNAQTDVIPRAAADSPRPVSFSQRGMWLRQMLEPRGTSYNLSLGLRLRGPIDRAACGQAVRALVERHEAFRTTLALSAEEPVQVISEHWHGDLEFIDLLDLPTSAREDKALTLLRERAAQPFDLAAGPLHWPLLVRIGEADHAFVWLMHHVIADGWSFGILLQEFSTLYNALLRREAPALAPLVCSYSDYTAWQRRQIDDQAMIDQLRYWQQQLRALEPMQLPTDRAAPTQRASRGSHVNQPLTQALLGDLRRFSAAHSVTPFMTLLAALKLVLARYCAQQDVFVGIPIAGRTNSTSEGLVGTLVNTLVLRSNLSGHSTFGEFLQSVRATALQAYVHQDLPFDVLVDKLRRDRGTGGSIDLRVLFNVLNAPRAVPRLSGLDVDLFSVDNGAALADLSLVIDLEGARRATLSFATDLFDATTAQRLLSNYLALLGQVLTEPDRALDAYHIASEADRRLQASYNPNCSPYPSQARVTDLIAAAAAHVPDAPALEFGVERLSHGELQTQAIRLARELRSRGIGRGALVGLCVERSVNMVVAQLAILQSGAAYVPLDPAYPAQRLAYMATDADMALLVTESSLSDLLDWPHSLLLDLDAASIASRSGAPLSPDATLDARADDPAYVIYTSGSTGQPKGVVVPHRAVVNFLTSMAREPGMRAADRWLAVTTLSFDISLLELLLPLSVGAQVVLASREQAGDGHALRSLLESSRATGMQATPATWHMLVEAGWMGGSTFKALVGGESLPLDLSLHLLARSGEVWNMYGPTETTVWSTCWQVAQPEQGISIGRPIANTTVWILDERLQICPVGVPGEICIGGDGVALGYLHRPELSAERFIADSFSDAPGARLYRTGDRGRWRSDGLLECLGRFDDQIKLRGHRIELGEVEAGLASHPDIEQAVVITREDTPGDMRLVAFVVPRRAMPADNELRAHLRRRLPEYMVPQHFVAIASVPRLPNGKTDRSGLPVPTGASLQQGHRNVTEPRTDNERAIAAVWREMLGVDTISVTDNFFDLGGHSLLAMRAIAEIERRIGHRISPQSFIYDGLAQMAGRVGAATSVAQASRRAGIVVRLKAAATRLGQKISGR